MRARPTDLNSTDLVDVSVMSLLVPFLTPKIWKAHRPDIGGDFFHLALVSI